MRATLRTLAFLLALFAIDRVLVAEEPDIKATPANGGGFVVTDAGNTLERLRVNEDGSVFIPGLVTTLATDGWVCWESATGRLTRCAEVPQGPQGPPGPPGPAVNLTTLFYTKKCEFDVSNFPPVQSFVCECSSPLHMAVAGVCFNRQFDDNTIFVTEWQDFNLRCVMDVTNQDFITLLMTCFKKL